MRWFLRSAVAAAGLGTVGTLALAQPAPIILPAPAGVVPTIPVAPPLESQPTEWEPATPLAPSVAPPTPGRTLPEQLHAVPTPPLTRDPQEQLQIRPVRVPDVSPAKPAPVVTVQAAIPTYSTPPAPIARVSGRVEEPPDERPSYLPPALPTTVALPAPPSPGPLPAIPIAPPLAVRPPALAPPVTPTAPPAVPPAPIAAQPPALPPVPPLPAPGPAALAADAACATASAPCRATDRLRDVMCDPVWHALPQDGAVRVRGWLDGGYVYNSSNPRSKFNGPYNSVDRSAEPMFNQGYLIVDHALPTNGSFGAGFRVDALFGYDFFLGQSRGFEVDRDGNKRWNGQYYGLALPQAYAELGNNVLSFKFGHFYSPVGYEMLPSTGNFFYSHAYSYQFGQPITLWGGLATTQPTRNWQFQFGVVNGWDTLVGRTNEANVLGGIKYTPDSRQWWSSFSFITGDQPANPAGLPNVPFAVSNRSRYSFLVGLTPGGDCGRWEYVFHHYIGWQENGTPTNNATALWYGIDQYLYYRVCDTVKLGTRFEWFRDEDGTRVGLNRPADPNKPPLPGNYFALTAGVNYAPTANLMLRPEIRWDFTSNTTRPAFNDGKNNNQLLLGCDLIWQF